MAVELFANATSPSTALATTLNGGINSSVTSLTVTSSTGFPAAVAGVSQFRALIESEIVLVTAVSGTTWTVVRGQEGTTAASHADTVAVTYVVTAGALNNITGRIVKVKTATETVNNSATLQNDDHLSFPVTAGETWVAELALLVTAPTNTADLAIAFSTPASTTGVMAAVASRGTDALVNQIASSTALSTAYPIQIFGGVSTPTYLTYVHAVFNVTTTGTVTLQWAQNTATASDTSLVAGSSLIAMRTT